MSRKKLFSEELLLIEPITTKINSINFYLDSPESDSSESDSCKSDLSGSDSIIVHSDLSDLNDLLNGISKNKEYTEKELKEFKDIRTDIEAVIRKRHSSAIDSSEIGLTELEKLINYNKATTGGELSTSDIRVPDLKKEQKYKTKKNLYNLCTYNITDNRNGSKVLDAKLYTINSANEIFNKLLKQNADNAHFNMVKNQNGIDSSLFLQAWEDEHGLRYLVTYENQENRELPTRQLRIFHEGAPTRYRPSHAQGTGDPNQKPGIKATAAGKIYINSVGKIYKMDNNSGGFKPKFETLVWPLLILHLTKPELLADTIELFEVSKKNKNISGRTIFIKKESLNALVQLLTDKEQNKIKQDNLLSESESIIKLQYNHSGKDCIYKDSERKSIFAKKNKNFMQRMNLNEENKCEAVHENDSDSSFLANNMLASPQKPEKPVIGKPRKLFSGFNSTTPQKKESTRTEISESMSDRISPHSIDSISDCDFSNLTPPSSFSSKSLDYSSDSSDSSMPSQVLDEVVDHLELNQELEKTLENSSYHSSILSKEQKQDKTPIKRTPLTQRHAEGSPTLLTSTHFSSLRLFDSGSMMTPEKQKKYNDENTPLSCINTPQKDTTNQSPFSPAFISRRPALIEKQNILHGGFEQEGESSSRDQYKTARSLF